MQSFFRDINFEKFTPVLEGYEAYSYIGTVFENHRKSRIQHCERSELCLNFQWIKVHYNAKNGQSDKVLET